MSNDSNRLPLFRFNGHGLPSKGSQIVEYKRDSSQPHFRLRKEDVSDVSQVKASIENSVTTVTALHRKAETEYSSALKLSRDSQALVDSSSDLMASVQPLVRFLRSDFATESNLDSLQMSLDEVRMLLEATKANLVKLKLFSGAQLKADVSVSIDSTLKGQESLGKLEDIKVKVEVLLAEVMDKLDDLVRINGSIDSLESKLNPALEYVHLDALSLDAVNSLDIASSTLDSASTDLTIQTDLLFGKTAELAGMVQHIDESIVRAVTVGQQMEYLKERVATAMGHKKDVEQLVKTAALRCEAVSSFIIYLEQYLALFIQAGTNALLEQRGFQYKVHGKIPAKPTCPPIEYVKSTTPPPPPEPPTTTTNAPSEVAPEKGCAPLTIQAENNKRWYFTIDRDKIWIRPNLGYPSGSTTPKLSEYEVRLTNNGSQPINIRIEVELICNSNDSAEFQLRSNGKILPVKSLASGEQMGGAPTSTGNSVRFSSTDLLRHQQAKVVYEINLGSNASTDLTMYGYLHGFNNFTYENFFVRNFNVVYKDSLSKECSEQLSATTEKDANDGNIDSKWHPCSKLGSFFVGNVYSNQVRARKNGKPKFSSNRFTTGENSLEVVKFVQAKFVYNNVDRRVFSCYSYTNVDKDSIDGHIEYDFNEETLDEFVKTMGGWTKVIVEDWEVMKRVFDSEYKGVRYYRG